MGRSDVMVNPDLHPIST